jgi:CRP-like cAMP-binding protein
VDELAALLGERAYPAGAVLFRFGELPARVHIIRRGAVELSRRVGGRRVVLQVLRAGDVFGDVPLLVRMTEPFDARALEDSVVLSADSVALFRLLERRPRLAQRWLVSLAARMAATQARLVDLLAGGLDAQVASVLTREAEQGVVRLAQSVIAELLGARRTSVNRVLKRFEARGLVRVGYGQVEIVDPPGLLMVAGGEPDERKSAPAVPAVGE